MQMERVGNLGGMILHDPSDDDPWLGLTLGPSKSVVEEFMRMNREEAHEEHNKKPPSKSSEMALVDSSDDETWLQLKLSRARKVHCRYCGKPFYNRQVLGGHTVRCRSKISFILLIILMLIISYRIFMLLYIYILLIQ